MTSSAVWTLHAGRQLCPDSPPFLSLCQVKCDQYWPSRGTETYGMIQVTMLDTVELATYSVRTFALYKVKEPPPPYCPSMRRLCLTAVQVFL